MSQSLQNVLSELQIQFKQRGEHKKAREGWLQIQCPWCNSGRWHHGLSTSAYSSTCYNCGRHRIGETLARASGRGLGDVLRLLGVSSRARVERTQHTGILKIPYGTKELAGAHRRYLEGRGFDCDLLVRLWGVQGIGNAVKLKWRLWIPICDSDGIPVSWSTRSISPTASLRYISADPTEEALNHRTLLYGEHYARNSIIVHEGFADVWRTGPGAVGTMGLSVTPSQVVRIAAYPVRWICFDNEPDAQIRANRLADELCVFPGETGIIRIESAKDAAEAEEAEVSQIRQLLY